MLRKRSFRKVSCISLLLLTICLVCLSGCAITKKGKLKEKTNEIMTNLQQMEKQLLKDRENVNGQNVTGEKISQYLADCASKVTYQIKDVDTDNNTVTITCTYIDSSQIFANAFTRAYTEALSNALSQAFSGGGASIDFDIDSIFMEEANKVTEPVYVTKDVVLKFQEGEDGYELKENDNTDLYVVALSNLFGSFSEGVN